MACMCIDHTSSRAIARQATKAETDGTGLTADLASPTRDNCACCTYLCVPTRKKKKKKKEWSRWRVPLGQARAAYFCKKKEYLPDLPGVD